MTTLAAIGRVPRQIGAYGYGHCARDLAACVRLGAALAVAADPRALDACAAAALEAIATADRYRAGRTKTQTRWAAARPAGPLACGPLIAAREVFVAKMGAI